MRTLLAKITNSVVLYLLCMSDAHAAGVSELIFVALPLGWLFSIAILVAIIKNALPSRKKVVFLVVALHVVFGAIVVGVTFKKKGVFEFGRLDILDIYVIYPILSALYLFFSYNIADKFNNDKIFSYLFLSATIIIFVVITLFLI